MGFPPRRWRGKIPLQFFLSAILTTVPAISLKTLSQPLQASHFTRLLHPQILRHHVGQPDTPPFVFDFVLLSHLMFSSRQLAFILKWLVSQFTAIFLWIRSAPSAHSYKSVMPESSQYCLRQPLSGVVDDQNADTTTICKLFRLTNQIMVIVSLISLCSTAIHPNHCDVGGRRDLQC